MKTQAWGWLAAGVLAAGLNAAYHDGGLEWAHRMVEQVTCRTSAVLALASGRAEQLLADAQLLTARDETASCRLGTALAQIQTGIMRSELGTGRFEAMSAREEAQLARLEANRARIEAFAAQAANLRMTRVAFNSMAFNPARVAACSRVRVNIPRMPRIKIPAPPIPSVHIEAPSAGPV